MSDDCELLKCMLCCEEEYYEDYEREECECEWTYTWPWTWGRNLFRESPSSETFFTSSDPSPSYYDYHPVCRSDPDTTISGGNVKRRNSSHIGSTRLAASTTLETPSTPFVSLRVPTTPYIPPRVSNNPPSVVIDSGLSFEAESLNLSSFSLYPPPSSKPFTLAKSPPLSSSFKQSTSSPKLTRPVSKSLPTSSGLSSSTLKVPLPLFKSTLAPTPSTSSQHGRTNYVWVEKGTSPVYVIPNDVEDLIKKGIVPGVLKRPLSPSTYKDYFGALLYAEDFYFEKWSNYLLRNISVELHKASIFRRTSRNTFPGESDDKNFVAFEMESVPERRPFLLSRDFVYLQPSDGKVEPFQGVIYRVVKSNVVLVEFNEDFHYQHYPACKYNVSFSFNRFCLKRAHQAVEVASDPSFQNFLFPDSVHRNLSPPTFLSSNHKLDFKQTSAILRILSLSRPPPYLVEGPLSVLDLKHGVLSKTGWVVQEAIIHIIRTSPESRVLVCAPTNNTCDVLMRSLRKEISESDMFRANAAFRELDGVPVDVLPSCRYRDECFTCPSLKELKKFKVVLSTFVSSFRLHSEGITAGHFSHIFLVDASSTTEPETMVALANLANDNTAVVVTGAPNNRTRWVRSDIARQNGLRISYFERLRESNPYKTLDPMFISQLENTRQESDDTYRVQSFSVNCINFPHVFPLWSI